MDLFYSNNSYLKNKISINYILTFIQMLIIFSTITFSQSLKSPEEFLGYKVGTDYKIADYETITKYFKHLSENSKKILFQNIGKTSQGRDMFMSIISSEENLANLDKYKKIIHKLFDPRKTT